MSDAPRPTRKVAKGADREALQYVVEFGELLVMLCKRPDDTFDLVTFQTALFQAVDTARNALSPYHVMEMDPGEFYVLSPEWEEVNQEPLTRAEAEEQAAHYNALDGCEVCFGQRGHLVDHEETIGAVKICTGCLELFDEIQQTLKKGTATHPYDF